MEEKINEELRQFKLLNIQETESKLRRFKTVYDEIKENNIIKFSKNASSNILRVLLFLLTFSLLILGLFCFFPEQIIDFMNTEGEYLSITEKKEMISDIGFFKYILLGLSFLFGSLSYLLKVNNRKRSTIHSLSKLLEEVMFYMEDSSFKEKRKYEYFVDSLAEKENINNTTK
jgi:hypothetical protein